MAAEHNLVLFGAESLSSNIRQHVDEYVKGFARELSDQTLFFVAVKSCEEFATNKFEICLEFSITLEIEKTDITFDQTIIYEF
jgi:hypothetical protein